MSKSSIGLNLQQESRKIMDDLKHAEVNWGRDNTATWMV
jgi:hypothetical protein